MARAIAVLASLRLCVAPLPGQTAGDGTANETGVPTPIQAVWLPELPAELAARIDTVVAALAEPVEAFGVSPNTARTVIEAYYSEPPRARGQSVQGPIISLLRLAGPRAVPQFDQCTRDPDPVLRQRATAMLGWLVRAHVGHTKAYLEFEREVLVPLFVRTTYDVDPRTRDTAVGSLYAVLRERTRDLSVDDLVPELRRMLHDPDPSVARSAAEALFYTRHDEEGIPEDILEELRNSGERP